LAKYQDKVHAKQFDDSALKNHCLLLLLLLFVVVAAAVVDVSLKFYRVFHGFEQAKFPDCGLVLGLSQFSILPKLPPKMLLNSKVVKIDPKIIISLR